MSSHQIVPSDFCKAGEILEGSLPVSGLERLASTCADTTGEVVWKVVGSLDIHQRPRLLLSVSGDLCLVCQRCLDVMPFRLDTETAVIVTFSEPEADEVESALDDDDRTEVVVSDGKVDVMDLIEDEALLALPLSARHDVCPDKEAGRWKEKKASPFAVLGQLKRGNGNKK